jgi:hypothetical protein
MLKINISSRKRCHIDHHPPGQISVIIQIDCNTHMRITITEFGAENFRRNIKSALSMEHKTEVKGIPLWGLPLQAFWLKIAVQGWYIPVCYVPIPKQYVPVCYIPAFLHPHTFHPWSVGPYSGLGEVRLNAQPIHGLVELAISRVKLA